MKISHRQKMKFDQRFFFGEKRWFSTGASNSKNHPFSKNCLNQRVFERIPWLKNLKGGEPRISSRISKNGHPMNTWRCKKWTFRSQWFPGSAKMNLSPSQCFPGSTEKKSSPFNDFKEVQKYGSTRSHCNALRSSEPTLWRNTWEVGNIEEKETLFQEKETLFIPSHFIRKWKSEWKTESKEWTQWDHSFAFAIQSWGIQGSVEKMASNFAVDAFGNFSNVSP